MAKTSNQHTGTYSMLVCDFKNGAWEQPKIMPYQNISIAPSARVFHYGQAIFEGMKAYKDQEGAAWLFRPEENFKRFNTSCVRMAMPEIREDYFFDGLQELLKLDQNWIKSGAGNSLYIRPFMIASEAGVSASPATEYKFMIICSPAQAYYGAPGFRSFLAPPPGPLRLFWPPQNHRPLPRNTTPECGGPTTAAG